MTSTRDSGRPSWQRSALLVLVLRAWYTLFACVTALVQPVNWFLVRSNALTENLPAPARTARYALLDVWQRFDTLWYLHIAAHGYDRADAVVFFPVYPALVRLGSIFMPPIGAALLISTVSSFFLFWGFEAILRDELPSAIADRAWILCAVWPASFIFFAGYPESLLLALIVWSLQMARKRRWPIAVALGVVAALTKAVGAVLVVPLLIMAIRRRDKAASTIILIPLASALFLEWLLRTEHQSISSAYIQYWRTSPAWPWDTLRVALQTLIHARSPILLLNFISFFAVCALVVLSRMRLEYVLYSTAALILFLCKQTAPPLQSMVRYVLVVFPAFVGASRAMQSPRLQPRFGLVCMALFVINAGLMWLFLGWSLIL
jgi:hypothetical protein